MLSAPRLLYIERAPRSEKIYNKITKIMETLLGLLMVYALVHGVIIVSKRIENTTQYENAVLIGAFCAWLLYIIDSLS